ncbi:MAG TPA: ATP-dependent Clp protease proteolytic subunit [Archangium sp.]|nr:ATP-dependent Clp protease proteolytic subunit [Archangium sp.]
MGHAPWWRRLWNAVRFTQAGAVPGRPELAPLEADKARLLKERVVVVDAFIDDTVATRTIAQLLFLEDQDARKGVTLHLDSGGGSVSAALALCDTLVRLKCPVATVCTGFCAGMATVVLACGRPGRRAVKADSRILLNSLRAEPVETGQVPSEVLREVHRMSLHVTGLLALHTGQPMERVREDCQRERHFDAWAAKDYGLIDVILPPRV